MTREEKIRALVEEGGETREQAIESLINSGEIEADDYTARDHNPIIWPAVEPGPVDPSESELERIAENVGIPFWMRV